MAAKDLRTVFVRGVSFDADEKDLEAAFSDVGPVKQCFLVRVKGQPKHRGFGFVQYALPEDAERAVSDMDGKSLRGRKLQVELADKRAPLEERKKKRKLDQDSAVDDGATPADQTPTAKSPPPLKQKAPPPATTAAATTEPATAADPAGPAAKQPSGPPAKRPRSEAQAAAAAAAAAEKHKLLRAVAIGKLTSEATPLAIALAKKAGPVEEVLNPAPQDVVRQAKLEADGCTGGVIIVIYATVKDAMTAVSKLHNQVVTLPRQPTGKQRKQLQQQQQQQQQGGGKAGRKGKKAKKGKGHHSDEDDEEEEDGEEGGEAGPQRVTLWARKVKGEGAHVKQWRVIIRNLAFKATEAALVKALQPVGFVWELKLPRRPDGRITGFAFAAFTCRAHAEKAIADLNGKELFGRMVVVDWALSKNQYEAAKGPEDKAGSEDPELVPSEGGEDEDVEDEDGDQEDDDEGEEDDAEGEDEDEEEEEIGLGSDDEDGDEDGEEGDSEELEDEDEDDGEEDEEDDDADGEEEEEDGEEAEARRERGILSSVLEEVIQQHEGAVTEGAGGVGQQKQQQQKQARLQEQQKKGKEGREQAGGVPERQAWQGEEADDPDAEEEPASGASKPARGAASASASLATTVFVRGLPLDATSPQLQARLELFGPVKACRLVMDRATGKPKGTAFVEFREEDAAKKAAEACARGRRNEGPGITLAGRQLDVDLALTGEGARNIAMQRQSSKAASKDRRNMYLAKEGHITEGSPAWNGMSAHDQAKRKRAAEEKNVKLRSPNFVISRTRLSVRNIPPSWNEAQLRKMFVEAVKQRATKENPRVLQAKILREQDKYDASGARKSKGLGFVEFESHDHALVALRQLNNNPGTPWGRDRRPIIEFAIDNVKVLKKIEHFRQKAAAKRTEPQQKQQQQRQRQQEEDGQDAAADAAGQGDDDNDGAEGADDDAPRGAKEKKEKGKKKKQKKGDEGAAPRPREAPAAGGSEGGEGGAAALSKRQRKRLRQKERVETKKQLLKEGGIKALVEAVEAGKLAGKPPQRQQAPAATGANGITKERPQGKQQPVKPGKRREGDDGGQQQRRKRRAEEDELDRIAEQGLSGAGGHGAKRRRRGALREEGEGGEDRLDRLVSQYKAKLAGDKTGGAKAGGAKAGGAKAGGQAAGRARKQNSGRPAGSKAAAGAKAEGGGGKAAGGDKVAAIVAGAASGGLRRWFDG